MGGVIVSSLTERLRGLVGSTKPAKAPVSTHRPPRPLLRARSTVSQRKPLSSPEDHPLSTPVSHTETEPAQPSLVYLSTIISAQQSDPRPLSFLAALLAFVSPPPHPLTLPRTARLPALIVTPPLPSPYSTSPPLDPPELSPLPTFPSNFVEDFILSIPMLLIPSPPIRTLRPQFPILRSNPVLRSSLQSEMLRNGKLRVGVMVPRWDGPGMRVYGTRGWGLPVDAGGAVLVRRSRLYMACDWAESDSEEEGDG